VWRELLALGFDAAALEGGYNAWRKAYPVEPKGGRPVPAADGDRVIPMADHSG
jgi:hypothetical protein